MKAVIFAGGQGTRIFEESWIRPKAMVEIGNKPILWHIMKIYSHYGINDFIICCGYKSFAIKEYFSNYFLQGDITFDLRNNKMDFHDNPMDPWKVTLVDTGQDTMTGGRLKRVREYIGNETFCLTYGDGLSNVNINDLIAFHRKNGGAATLVAVQPPSPFGTFTFSEDELRIKDFKEKALTVDSSWINGGFFVCEPTVINLIADDSTVWEKGPLENLADTNKLFAYRHHGFWHSMDTLKDKNNLEELWKSGNAPWKLW